MQTSGLVLRLLVGLNTFMVLITMLLTDNKCSSILLQRIRLLILRVTYAVRCCTHTKHLGSDQLMSSVDCNCQKGQKAAVSFARIALPLLQTTSLLLQFKPRTYATTSFPTASACTIRLSGFFADSTSALDSLVHLVPAACGGGCLPLCFQSLYAALTVAGPSMGTMSLLTNCSVARLCFVSRQIPLVLEVPHQDSE